jgi:acetoin utilization deacetylase AcuC-like enzyme
MGPIASVHPPDYLHFLKNIFRRWQRIEGASEEVIPNVHPNRRSGGYPDSAVGQAGWHMADTACPIGPQTWTSVLASANNAVDAARYILDGTDSVYALCRPPGHHAFSDMAGGFCYLNNTAIAAQHLREGFRRIAILDVDLSFISARMCSLFRCTRTPYGFTLFSGVTDMNAVKGQD